MALLLPLVDEELVPLDVTLPEPVRLAVAHGEDEEDEDSVALPEDVGEEVVSLDRLAESVALLLPLVVPLELAVNVVALEGEAEPLALLLPVADDELVPLDVVLTVPVRLAVADAEAEADNEPVAHPEAVGV